MTSIQQVQEIIIIYHQVSLSKKHKHLSMVKIPKKCAEYLYSFLIFKIKQSTLYELTQNPVETTFS